MGAGCMEFHICSRLRLCSQAKGPQPRTRALGSKNAGLRSVCYGRGAHPNAYTIILVVSGWSVYSHHASMTTSMTPQILLRRLLAAL